jgi:hypothetical protein
MEEVSAVGVQQPVAVVDTDQTMVPGIKSEMFAVTLDSFYVNGNVMLMQGSCFIWLGMGEARLAHLNVAMPTKYDPIPITTTLINELDGDSCGMGLVQRLSKKFGMQIFSSVNVETDNEFLWQLIEKRLVDILSVHYCKT